MDCVESDSARRRRMLRDLYKLIEIDLNTCDEDADLDFRALTHIQTLIEITQE